MKPGLSLRITQHLALTPQLQQSIRLLQLSTLELSQEIGHMLDENPFLELLEDEVLHEGLEVAYGDALAESAEDATEEQSYFIAESADAVSPDGQKDAESLSATDEVLLDWEGDGCADTSALDDAEWGDEAPARGVHHDGDAAATALELACTHESLSDFLHQQALSLRLSEIDRCALRFLIESLNDDGYLEDSLEALAEGLVGSEDVQQSDELLHRLTVALYLLQSMEPVGVGARNLSECLRLQLQHLQHRQFGQYLPHEDPACLEAALLLCEQPLELLARRDVRKLMQVCGQPEAMVRAALSVIARLEPKPGRRFVDVKRHLIVPDVIVTKTARPGCDGVVQLGVQLNPDVLPRLRVHEVYASAVRGHKGSEGHAGLQQRLQEARWFIKNVQQRFDTILRVSRAIVERQKNFFIHGELAMRPLVLREIADALDLHESTISRVTTAKYMATSQGTYELKFFFGSGLETEAGGSASSTAVRALIRQMVAAENTQNPLSDSQIAELLQEQGVACARRTVAKYREVLKIAPVNLRKAL